MGPVGGRVTATGWADATGITPVGSRPSQTGQDVGDVPIHEARTGQGAHARQLLIESAFVLLLIVLLAVTGPFGTYQTGDWPVRLAYWSRTLLVGYLFFRPGLMAASAGARALRLPEPAGWAAAVLVLSVPMSLWLWFVGPKVDLDRSWPSTGQFIETYAQIAFIAGLATAALWWLGGAGGERAANHGPAADSAETMSATDPASTIGDRLADRLPLHLGREVIALEMEDHYVRVHTAAGSTLVLMRMGDAVAELSGIDGLRVHRSWWAARSAVQAVERTGRTTVLRLTNGLQVPVARDRLSDLGIRGWLDAA